MSVQSQLLLDRLQRARAPLRRRRNCGARLHLDCRAPGRCRSGSGPFVAAAAVAAMLLAAAPAPAARLKDIAFIEGVRANQLWGYGIVVGLNGTGDSQQALFTAQSILNMLRRRGLTLTINPRQLQLKNVAAVVVTADLPPFAHSGNRLDVLVSSLGDADSLQGGTLLQTPLFGADQEVYAVAQGAVSLGGGFSASGVGASTQKSHPTAGYISGGAIVEREVTAQVARQGVLTVSLQDPDFTTASRVAAVINRHLGREAARARDAGTIQVDVAGADQEGAVRLATQIETLEVAPDQRARVVLNERTGTVIMGEAVRVMPIAIAHGSLTVNVKTDFGVSQPAPFAERGRTVVVPDTTLSVQEGKERSLAVLQPGVSLGELVGALNALGVTPQDLIAILEAIRAAGALQAEIEIM
jgi:flagellar P-ring protein precursor FlgI